MTVTYHSMIRNRMVTVTLTVEYEAELRKEYESLPFHDGFTNFEDFVACVLFYNEQ